MLSTRQVNRATLARQHLLERARMSAFDLIAHLIGLQAQESRDPYIGLWSRLVDFEPSELEALLLDRRVVRLVAQRGTVHAVTAADALVLRPLAQPLLTQQLHTHGDYAPLLVDVDLGPVMTYARTVLAEPRNTRDLRAQLAAKFPEYDAAALAFACRNLLPFVQVPPRGLWARGGQVVGTTVHAWLGEDVAEHPSVDDVIVRYLGAFGPATVQDAATWSRYTGLREVFERLRSQLRTDRDADGREYFDIPDGPMPDPETPAPVRLLPQYDNVLLSHKDRSRFAAPGAGDMGALWLQHTGFVGSVLVDGALAGAWRIETAKPSLTITIKTPAPVRDDVAAALTGEAEQLLRFVDRDAEHSVTFRAL